MEIHVERSIGVVKGQLGVILWSGGKKWSFEGNWAKICKNLNFFLAFLNSIDLPFQTIFWAENSDLCKTPVQFNTLKKSVQPSN